ncbi:UDP-3-O-(3-hydroxymyristoyl)glucosamine N-acyltransferase [Fibrobacterota bacterium]
MLFKKPASLSGILDLVKPLEQSDIFLPSGKRIPEKIISLDGPRFSTPSSITFISKKNPPSVYKSLNPAFAFSEMELGITQFPYLAISSVHEAIRLVLEENRNNFARLKTGKSYGAIHSSATVEGKVEKGARVGAGCFIGHHSLIRKGTVLEPNVTIMENCEIGSDCFIQSGAVIGASGFGFYQFEGEIRHMPHPAGVRIGNRVWIGANTVIAAGVLNPTVVENDCKLDSHVQIAHNVFLGPYAMIASQSGIAGSTSIGSRLLMGGASSIAGHLTLGDEVTVAARTGVTKNLPDKALMAGYPAQPLKKWKRQQIYLRQKAEDR